MRYKLTRTCYNEHKEGDKKRTKTQELIDMLNGIFTDSPFRVTDIIERSIRHNETEITILYELK